MFAKLLKYEWKATGGLLGIFSLAAIIAGGVGAVALRFIIRYSNAMMDSILDDQGAQVEAITVSGLSMLLVFVILALFAYYLGTQIILLYRFYKNKFTDEGYLTFTLPVKSHEILAASWLNMLIWTLISILVLCGALAIMMISATSGVELPGKEVWDDVISYYGDMSDSGMEYAALTVATSLVEWIIAPLIAMTCITIGAVGAKKHKILLAIAVYYGYRMISGIVSTVVTAVVTIVNYQAEASFALGMPLACGMMVQVLVAVLCWFLTNYLINSKLNLP